MGEGVEKLRGGWERLVKNSDLELPKNMFNCAPDDWQLV